MTPFRTPARQNGPAVGRLHANAKTVGFRPVTVIRLKRTFWH
jgi:hypothetical protein